MSVSWNINLTNLIMLLASLYSNSDRAILVARGAGLDPADIDFTGPSKVIWLRIVEEANKRDSILELLRIAKADFPNVDFDTLRRLLGQRKAPEAPELVTWRGASIDAEQLEKVTGQQPTFLPVSFLE